MSNSNNNWKRVGGFSRTGTQNYVRTTDAAMGGTTFGPTDISYNSGNTTLRIGNNSGVIFINGDIDMSGGATVAAPINRIRNVRDPILNQDVATKFYVDRKIDALDLANQEIGPTGPVGPPGIGFARMEEPVQLAREVQLVQQDPLALSEKKEKKAIKEYKEFRDQTVRYYGSTPTETRKQINS